MVEPLLYAALGFLVASLLGLFVCRAVWNRAVRLTTKRVMRRLPLSRDEIVAARDFLRAEQAVAMLRLERQTERMRERLGEGMAELGRRDATIHELRTALASKSPGTATQDEMVRLSASLAEARARIAAIETEREELRGQLDTQQVEAAALNTDLASRDSEIETLQSRLRAAQKEADSLRDQLQADSGTDPEGMALLREQIDRLANDIARAVKANDAENAKADATSPA